MNYVVLYNNAHTNAKKEEFMIKWIKNLFKPKRHTPVIEPYLNSNHEQTMKRKVSVPMGERRVAAARDIEFVKENNHG
jgi:hypothetical protein|tara:strand:+ start:1504 stop:1737 length:234 start_codon:yes stop_codon:yes gene_type:complete